MNDIHRLDNLLPEAYLIPGFITASEEAYLLTKVEECGGTPVDDDADSLQGTSTDSPRRFRGKAAGWKEVKGRRLMYWGGSVHPKGNTLIPLPLPAFMDRQFPNILQRVRETGAFNDSKHGPNHVLVNEYLPGQGIFPHQDGPAYFPTVATLSLGSYTILDIFGYSSDDTGETGAPSPSTSTSTSTSSSAGVTSATGPGESRAYDPTPRFSILLPRRTLFILRNELYTAHLHGIRERHTDSLDELRKCVNWDHVSARRARWEMGDQDVPEPPPEANAEAVDTSTEPEAGAAIARPEMPKAGSTDWERGRRVSLTIRAVEKVLKGNVLGLVGGRR